MNDLLKLRSAFLVTLLAAAFLLAPVIGSPTAQANHHKSSEMKDDMMKEGKMMEKKMMKDGKMMEKKMMKDGKMVKDDMAKEEKMMKDKMKRY